MHTTGGPQPKRTSSMRAVLHLCLDQMHHEPSSARLDRDRGDSSDGEARRADGHRRALAGAGVLVGESGR